MKNYINLKNINNLLYYSPEIYALKLGHQEKIRDNYNDSKKFIWIDMNRRIITRESFIIESVFSKKEKVEFLEKSKKTGYSLHCLYIGTKNYNINIERIADRVQKGSYTIPREKIIDRYNKSMKYLYKLFELSKDFIALDNSEETPRIVCYKNKNEVYFFKNCPDWINQYLVEFL